MSKERIPPQNLEAEQSFLGSLLVDKDAILRVADMLRAEDFYKPAHAEIFTAIMDLHAKREPIDMLTMANRLEEVGKLESIGGRTYLMELTTMVPTSAHIQNYANIIQKKATLRRLQSAAGNIITMSFDEVDDVDQLLDQAEQTLFGVSQQYLKTSFTPLKATLDGAFERIDELHRDKGKLRGITSGYRDLDKLLGGLQRSDLIIVAARPSVGKTSFAMDVARQAAIKSKLPVGVFSLEMSKEQLVDRMICAEAGVDLWRLRTGNLNDSPDQSDFSRIGHALGALSEAPIFIDDSANVNIMEIRTKARRLQTEHGLGMLVIDYLQLMESRRTRASDNRTQEVAEITRALKGIARELDIPVIALSQLSRTTEMSKPAIPKLSHLRESGCLTGDTIITLANGSRATMADLAARKIQKPLKIKALDDNWKLKNSTISRVFPSGKKEVFLMKTQSGRVIKASANHPFRAPDGWKRLDQLQPSDVIAVPKLSSDDNLEMKSDHIALDKIVSIESLGQQETYDATVPGLHNFIANGFIVHNSIEQDADVVMFIYRKAADKNYRTEEIPLDERYIAEIHVAKHRNGPCGTIKMYFDEARVSFRDLDQKYSGGQPMQAAAAPPPPAQTMQAAAPPPPQEVPAPRSASPAETPPPPEQPQPVGAVMPSPGPGSIPPGNGTSNAPQPNF
jgi:replicative DNA helicase